MVNHFRNKSQSLHVNVDVFVSVRVNLNVVYLCARKTEGRLLTLFQDNNIICNDRAA